MSLLSNVKCRWASIIEPNTKFEPVWEIQAELNDEQAKFFSDAGAKVTEDEGVKLVRFKRKVSGNKRGGGTYTNTPPRVVDGNKNPVTSLVGNGSVVNIQYELRPWEMMGNSGVAADLKAVQVVDLVEFVGGNKDEFDVVSGGDSTATVDDSCPF